MIYDILIFLFVFYFVLPLSVEIYNIMNGQYDDE